MAAFRPDVVGITGCTVHVNQVRRLCDQIKAWQPDTLTVVLDHHVTVVSEDFLSPTIDLIALGVEGDLDNDATVQDAGCPNAMHDPDRQLWKLGASDPDLRNGARK